MEIPLKYQLTPEMLDLIAKIEVKKVLLENLQIDSGLINNLQRESLLKSSLFSAKIEGNKLKISNFSELRNIDPETRERIEVENIISAFTYIKNRTRNIDEEFIFNLHKIIMTGLASELGFFRKEPSAIFNQSGFPVYIPPPPSEINGLIKKIIEYINTPSNENILIKASLAHISFEKIHPFIDGNGRVGRLLFQAVCLKGDYGFNSLISVEEILNEKKEEYYAYLDRSDATSFIEFLLDAILIQLQKTFTHVQNNKNTSENMLLPRRREVLEIIRDHKIVSLNLLQRRFFKVPGRTIRYDLKKLEESGFIIKLGVTRGAMYAPKIK